MTDPKPHELTLYQACLIIIGSLLLFLWVIFGSDGCNTKPAEKRPVKGPPEQRSNGTWTIPMSPEIPTFSTSRFA